MAQAILTFPRDFKWGTTSAAFSVEGNNERSDWWVFEQQDGAIQGNGRSGNACDWWRDPLPDLDRAAEMGTNGHRLSIEWSRVEPEPSVFDREALHRYRTLLQACLDRGIEPMVTLHHFSNPVWLAEKGDFDSDLVVDYFRRYVARVVEELGDLVSRWITFNEPQHYLIQCHLKGVFPPPTATGHGPLARSVENLLRCHAAAYHTIKAVYPQAQVSMALRVAPGTDAVESGWPSNVLARLRGDYSNDAVLNALRNGRLGRLGGRRIDNLAGAYDFVALNYYGMPPDTNASDKDFADQSGSGHTRGGLYQAIHHVTKRTDRDIFITGDGLPDSADTFRPAYILNHLLQIWHAISFCFPVMGYYHTSLVDGFEWDKGWTQQFGLVALDWATQERHWRPSGRLYQEICREFAISSEMVATYAPALSSEIFPGSAPVETIAV